MMSELNYYAGLDIGGTSIKYGLVDSTGRIINRNQKPTMIEKGAKPLLHLVTNIAENLLFQAAEEDLPVKWLGVGSPGTVDNVTGVVKGRCPNIPGWVGTELGSHLTSHLNTPVYVDNDANAMALAELRFGAARRFESALCITVGTGIGGGIIIDRTIWRGSSFSAGEIGHIVIKTDGAKCRCGNTGCLEAYCSSEAILRRTRKRMDNGVTEIMSDVLAGNLDNLNIKKLFVAAKKGDETALEVLEETATIMGAGLSGVINLLNPEALILGGGIIEGGAGFIETVGAEIRRRAYPSATENLRILKAELGNDAGFIGAGLLGEYKSNKS
ncbi:MAG: ROK family protein [Candidatus Zixiibacteriota bacterium]|nr:MAG: ROK family protein [candidate division Zixibacteria bacterium]